MRVLISVDMEDVAGDVAPDDMLPGGPEYERNRGCMTDDAGAAVRGVLDFDPGASVVIADAHARFRNLIPDRLARGCTLVRGAPRPHLMLTSIDTGVGAVVLVGHHGSGGTATSVLPHTISTATIALVRCNGVELGELGLAAALAARFGAVPALATGDDSLAGRRRASCRDTDRDCHARDRQQRRRGAASRRVVRTHRGGDDRGAGRHRLDRAPRFDGAVDLEVDLLRPALTERAMLIPGVERVAPATLGCHAADLVAAYDLIAVFAELASAP